jgi:hypothetical protein
MLVPIDLDGHVSEASANKIHCAIHAWRLMDRVILGHARPMFLSDHLVLEGALRIFTGC